MIAHITVRIDTGRRGMLGIDDPWIWTGYLFAIGLTLFCLIYGWLKFNDDGEDDING